MKHCRETIRSFTEIIIITKAKSKYFDMIDLHWGTHTMCTHNITIQNSIYLTKDVNIFMRWIELSWDWDEYIFYVFTLKKKRNVFVLFSIKQKQSYSHLPRLFRLFSFCLVLIECGFFLNCRVHKLFCIRLLLFFFSFFHQVFLFSRQNDYIEIVFCKRIVSAHFKNTTSVDATRTFYGTTWSKCEQKIIKLLSLQVNV